MTVETNLVKRGVLSNVTILLFKSDCTDVLIGLGNWDTGTNLGIETHWLFRLAVHPETERNYSHTDFSNFSHHCFFFDFISLQPAEFLLS